MGVNLAVIGSGGREHALCEALKDSDKVSKVFCFPGNGGTASSEGIENLTYDGFEDLYDRIQKNSIGLVVVGPEGPLSEGLADFLRERGVSVFGFSRKATRLESSKAFADEFKKKYGISRPDFEVFTDYEKAAKYTEERFSEGAEKLWIKADELCGGKGALGASSIGEAKEALKTLLVDKKCGEGEKVVVQDNLKGQEVTVLAFTDGETFITMPAMQDHKPVYEGGKGPNTGGMGAYSPVPVFDEEVEKKFNEKILKPTVEGIKKEGMQRPGIIYFGLMIDEDREPYVLEYNVRFGDPEAQPILDLLETGLYDIVKSAVEGKLYEMEGDIKWQERAAVCVVLRVKGYPVDYGDEHHEISGVEEADSMQDVRVYHSGTSLEDGKLYTDGGRVLGVTATGDKIKDARERAYRAVEKISFKEMKYRTDIADKAI